MCMWCEEGDRFLLPALIRAEGTDPKDRRRRGRGRRRGQNRTDRPEMLSRFKQDLSRGKQKGHDARWLVFEGDDGGQVFATIPEHMLPEDLTRDEIRRALEIMNDVAWPQPGEGIGYHFVKPFAQSWLSLRVQPFEPSTRVQGWLAIGEVTGGCGGGLLLERDMWFHWDFLALGVDFLNQVRQALRLQPLAPDTQIVLSSSLDEDLSH